MMSPKKESPLPEGPHFQVPFSPLVDGNAYAAYAKLWVYDLLPFPRMLARGKWKVKFQIPPDLDEFCCSWLTSVH